MKKYQIFTVIPFLALIFMIGCNNKDNENPNPVTESQIIVSPELLTLNDTMTGTLSFSVQPPSEFVWSVSTKPDWVIINPNSGTLNKQIIQVQVIPTVDGLYEGEHTGKIEIITNGAGKAAATIQLYVNAHPVAKVQPDEITIESSETQKTFFISNTGTGFLSWQLDSFPSWISFEPSSGMLAGGDNIEITATAIRNGLQIGTEYGQAILTSNSDEGDVGIDLTLVVPASAIISTSVPELDFGYFEDTKSFYVKNDGNIAYDWEINNSNSFLTIEPNSGNLAVGDSTEIVINVDRTNLETQVYQLDINIANIEGESLDFPITVEHYKEEKWLINGRIIDAEYDRNNDVIIAVSETPYEIRKFDPSDSSIISLDLNLPPTCVSVSQDGNFAAVGHNGKFSYIDLTTMELVEVYSVTTDALDIVLAPNGWVYVFPRADQWEHIRCVELSTGIETPHTGNYIYAGTKAKLHPSGDYIYGADNGLSPSDFEKYDITNGTAAYLYDSPYHGDFAFSGDIWISDDGNRLFARSRNVFNSSVSQSNDMTYNGELAGEGKVVTLDFSSNASRVYAIFTTGDIWNEYPDNQIRKYETQYLGFLGTIALPGFLIPDGTGGGTFYNSQGYFGFFNSLGTKYFVLVKAEDGSGAENEWAIVTVDVD